jgi:hypothetical protein
MNPNGHVLAKLKRKNIIFSYREKIALFDYSRIESKSGLYKSTLFQFKSRIPFL